MPCLAAQLKAIKKYGASPYGLCQPRIQKASVPDWPHYLAGFMTAEGYFQLERMPSDSLRPRLTIRQRADDSLLLKELCERTLAGKVYGPYDTPTNPMVSWTVASRDDLLRLIGIFDRSPPRGSGIGET